MRNLFVKTVFVDRSRTPSVAKALFGLLRGQWVEVDGMKARVVNFSNGKVVLWMKNDNILAVWP